MKFHQFISYVFHPVLVPMATTLWFFILAPVYIPKLFAYRILLFIFILTYLVPLILLVLLKKMNLITNYQLPTIKERKFPVLFTATVYFLVGNLLLNTHVLNLLAFSFFGYALSLLLVYILFSKNIKTSLHIIGITGIITFFGLLSYSFKANYLILIACSIIMLGIVATSRLKLEAHSVKEIITGTILGIATQLFSFGLYIYFYSM